MTIKVLYFLDGAVPTVDELLEIASLSPQTVNLQVRNRDADPDYYGRPEDTDFVAGTVPSDPEWLANTSKPFSVRIAT